MEVIANRAKIDWCFPAILQCERAIDKMVGIYINGDVSTGIKRHHVPVYRNKKSLDQKTSLSKVLKRIKCSNNGLPFLK